MNKTSALLARCFSLLATAVCVTVSAPAQEDGSPPASSTGTVSFHRDIRPIFQAHCYGCHQGARDDGGYVMTEPERLAAGGESGEIAIVPGDSSSSNLVAMIRHDDNGQAEMPLDADPLTLEQIDLVSQWIDAGAVDDSPRLTNLWTAANPPRYSLPPTIASIDVSPDGEWLAVSGLYEVLLIELATQKTVRHLVGQSPRIESVRFSPDGDRLAVAGGKPGEFGEIQVWSVEDGSLLLSRSITFDTLTGLSWSPDGKQLALGCTDNSVRAIDSESGEPLLFQKASEDWVRDTVFSNDGSHLVSVGRDMTCKLTEVSTGRFVDNITSITPGVLKGGIADVERHPFRDEIVVASADGMPKIYRIFRETVRVIGDDANLIRKFPAMPGRCNAVAVASDGKSFAAISSLDNASQLDIYSWDFDTTKPDEIKAIDSKVVTSRSAEEAARLEAFHTSNREQIATLNFGNTAIYSIRFSVDGQQVFAAGSGGKIFRIDTRSGGIVAEWSPFILGSSVTGKDRETESGWSASNDPAIRGKAMRTGLSAHESDIARLEVRPAEVNFTARSQYAQLVITAWDSNGVARDVTREASITPGNSSLAVDDTSTLFPVAEGTGKVTVTLGNQTATVESRAAFDNEHSVTFVRDVNPLLSRLGCNAGTCHGSQAGQRGFKLSLRGYDPLFDIRALVDELSGRRVNVAAPEQSLILLKSTGEVPHGGGALIARGDKYYSLIRRWIADGAKLDLDVPRVESIAVYPSAPVLQMAGDEQQLRVVATYTDGTTRDVTRECFVESSNTEVATISPDLRVIGARRGETALLARYEGSFAAAPLTVMGDRTGFVWTPPETWNRIDELVAEKWERMKINPSGLSDDATFLRRVSLDLTGLPPTPDQVRAFLADTASTRDKRAALIDGLVGNEAFIEHWTNKWADLLQVNRKFLAAEGAAGFRRWIREQVAENRPYDEFAREILTASGSNRENPAASYYKIVRTPEDTLENTTHLFLGIRFNCNKCHDHPFERWTQDQYYQTAAWFARVDRQRDPESGDRNIGGSAVESATPLFEVIGESDSGEMIHDRTKAETLPKFPFAAGERPRDWDPAAGSRREQFAGWLTAPENPWFARSYVNRLWGYLMGTGLIEPVDDIRAGNPPSNPRLLDWLTEEFIRSGFDTRHMIGLICKSRTYQLSHRTNNWNDDDYTNYSHSLARRLPAEVLFDSMIAATGAKGVFPGMPQGMRAAELPDAGAGPDSGFLATLGRPIRESVCECERSSEMQLGSVLALVSGQDQSRAINGPDNDLATLVAETPGNDELVRELYLRILCRPATEEEVELAKSIFDEIAPDHDRLVRMRDERIPVATKLLEEKEGERMRLLNQAEGDLAAYIAATDPELPDRESKRIADIARLKEALVKMESEREANFAAWQREELQSAPWSLLQPISASQTSGAAIGIAADRSVMIKNGGKSTVTITARVDAVRMSAVRIETLADPSLPSGGPGLAPNGNFVINEIEMEIAPASAPDQWQKVAFASAAADFSQDNFSPGKLFNGNREGGDGWAVSPALGQTHWVTLQLVEPVESQDGWLVRMTLVNDYSDGQHQPGRIRLAVSSREDLTGPGLSEEIRAALANSPETWTDPVREKLNDLYEQTNPILIGLRNSLGEAERPLMIDEGIIRRRSTVARLKIPVAPDAILQGLERDVATSEKQLQSGRLTAAQDLSWALINSPAFLFNH